MENNITNLDKMRFENTTHLVAFLKAKHTWKYDPETQKIYILDKTKARNMSKEFELKETEDKKFYLSEVK